MLRQLTDLLGRAGVLGPEDDIARHIHEPRGRFHGRPLAVARPDSTDQLARVVNFCREHRLPMVTQGGHTGLVGGGSASIDESELIISLERLNRIRRVDPDDASLVAEAGCTLAAVREAADAHAMLYPVSLASEGTATIGGTIATNAGGNLTIRYGNTRSQVLGLEVVLADGRVVSDLAPLRKDNSGYDIKQLFIGSEGTLGIISAATLALAARPAQTATAMVATDSLKAGLALLAQLRKRMGETLSACEFMPRLAMEFVLEYLDSARDPFDQPHPWYVLVQVDSAVDGDWLETRLLDMLQDTLSEKIVSDVVVADSMTKADQLWRLRESISPAQRVGGVSLKHDISVPVSSIPAFVEQASLGLSDAVPGIRPCIFGHLGDGNLHFNLSQPEGMDAEQFRALEDRCNRIIFDLVGHFNGSIAAEHGIGQLRRKELATGQPRKVELMRALKKSLDPHGLLNPGKVV